MKPFRSPSAGRNFTIAAIVGAVVLVGGCSKEEPRRRARSGGPGTQLPQEALHPDLTVPHGDHTPHKGGTVMMYGDLHYEVILDRSGRYELWLSDELRTELSATEVDGVIFTVRPADGEGETEVIALEPDAESTGWFGQGLPIDNSQTIARIGFEYSEERYWIDLMFPQAQFGVTEDGASTDAAGETTGEAGETGEESGEADAPGAETATAPPGTAS